jgi:predicted dehydrogenase
MSEGNRREFLFGAGAAALSVGAHRILGANDRIQVGIVGLGGRGRAHLGYYMAIPTAQVAAVCDIDQAAQERAVAMVEKQTGVKPRVFTDMRKMFEDRELNAVSIATPNHWHALATIWACQAGKDVYVEKPACHNVWEGLKMIEAARKYQRMVQVGSQGRSAPHKIRAMQLLKEGVIGKVYLAKGLCFKRRMSIGKKPDEPTPPGVDWDLFLGPAPMRPFNANRFRYNWHWFWDTGNGDIGNQGVHEMDIARWGLGDITWPRRVVSTGGKYVYDDDQETPNTQLATFDYGDAEVVFEVRGLITGGEDGLQPRGGNTIGDLFLGGEGYLAVDDGGFRIYKGEKRELAMEEKSAPQPGGGTVPHIENFFQAVRSRNYKDLTADVEIGVISASLCHLANISYRLKRSLNFDPKTVKFIGDAEANRMLTREYRKPYVVPEKV